MEKDESSISSTTISMGTMPQTTNSTPAASTRPWILLITGDFGYHSKIPEKINSSQWNDFFSNHSIECSGPIENNLPTGMQPFFLEYTINCLQDFSLENIIEKASILKPYKAACSIINDYQYSKISLLETHEKISRLSILDSTKMRILQELGNASDRNTPSSNPVQIDSILSMLDLGDTKNENTSDELKTPSENVISEIASSATTTPDYQKLCDLITEVINKIAKAIQQSPRFKTLTKSWYSLKNLAKQIGRNRCVITNIVSSPADDSEDCIVNSLNYCSNDIGTPDIIVWNYQYSSSTSSMQLLERVATIADRYKSLLITSLVDNDPLTTSIHSQQPVRTIIECDYMIPYRRLRANESCRSCVLGINPNYDISDNEDYIKANATWLITAQWIYSLLENKTPFQWPTKIQSFTGFTLTGTCSQDRLKEISAAGFTLSQNPVEGYSTPPVVIFDTGEDSPYHSAGFNFLVNRTARLSAEWFSENKNDDNEDVRANKLHKFLISELKPYHILSDESSIIVVIKNGVATIELNSEITIDSSSVHFQFTLEI